MGSTAFTVGHSASTVTKGMGLAPAPDAEPHLPLPLLVDTEGFSDAESESA